MTSAEEVLFHIRSEWETKIRNMQPGRELDALVAEKVMGYTTHGQFREKNGVRVMIDRYSADIAAAMEVLEKFQEYEVCKNGQLYVVAVGRPGYFARFSSLPEAICKAALLAVMADE